MGNSLGTVDDLGNSVLDDKQVGDPDDELHYTEASLFISKKDPTSAEGSTYSSNQGSLHFTNVEQLIPSNATAVDILVSL